MLKAQPSAGLKMEGGKKKIKERRLQQHWKCNVGAREPPRGILTEAAQLIFLSPCPILGCKSEGWRAKPTEICRTPPQSLTAVEQGAICLSAEGQKRKSQFPCSHVKLLASCATARAPCARQQQEPTGSDAVPMDTRVGTGPPCHAAQPCEREIFSHSGFWETATSQPSLEITTPGMLGGSGSL